MTRPPTLIRRATPDDAAAFTRLMADPAVFGNLMQLPYPSEATWRDRLAALAPGRDSAELQLVAERDGVLVGSLGLHPADRVRRRHVAMLGISVAAAHQRSGVGSALMQAACDAADGWLHLLRLELTVFTDNAAALALYRRFGFRVEGTHVGFALRHGRYADVHSMARLHPNPPPLAWPDPGASA